MKFSKFSKIENIRKAKMSITQKIHGTNAQIHIEEIPCIAENDPAWNDDHVEYLDYSPKFYKIRAGSRNRWIFPHDDNYGFAKFVYENKDDLVKFLGTGTHYGEWAGPGINSGEGLKEKTFFLFDWWRYPEEAVFPEGVSVVPVLYTGNLDMSKIDEAMKDLKENGSKLSPGFMRPEGIVVNIAGTLYKKPFEAEETQWTKSTKTKIPKIKVDFSHLCQPVRLEKLLSKDESYMRDYPKSLPLIVKDYVSDLIEEDQIKGDKDEIKSIKKGASSQIFSFVRQFIDEKGL